MTSSGLRSAPSSGRHKRIKADREEEKMQITDYDDDVLDL
eukprot:CAMPEP_0119091798 /NCGR_PEP_ID=MMETSP1178-20130426/157576_1 /TAXON_ID=33656 /ORGANISM="unid sp, Strain CCMP2000" /LENGTH=39 /DNA_ID= /DNA_START= /DNA_END= /DNA_ORIENTATION=